MEIQIQSMIVENAATLQRLSEQLGYSLSGPAIENNIREVIAKSDHLPLVAFYEGNIVGWIHAFRAVFLESTPFVEIGGLIVDENYRSRGIGKKLVDQIKKWCLGKNIIS